MENNVLANFMAIRSIETMDFSSIPSPDSDQFIELARLEFDKAYKRIEVYDFTHNRPVKLGVVEDPYE